MRYLIGLLRTRLLVGAGVAAAVLAIAGSAAGSGTYDVCPTGPPACGWTLTGAVTDAIATAGPDTLQLAPGTYLVDSVFLEGTYEPITIEGMGATAAAVVVMSTTRDVVTEQATTRPQPDTLENLTISGGAFAGIAQQNATLALQNVVVENNAGAGVSLSGGTVTISSSTISGNGRDGIDEGSALLTVTNSTISGNHGAGVVTDPSVGAIETSLRSDTIAQNHGFGLNNAMRVVNTISAGNAGGDCNRSPGIRGGPVSSGTNLSGDFSCGNFFTAGGDQVPTFPSTIDPRLGSLADNGGPTPTMALGTGSPAIGAGGVSCPGTDQRGFLRDASCDIGAYEAGAHGLPSASASTVGANPASVLADGVAASTITVTLKDAGGNPVSGDNVALSPDAGNSTISAPSGPSDANGQVTFGVSDATAETVSYSAEDADRGVFITQTAAVTFTTPGGGGPVVSATTSTVQASPASVPADGSTSSTITVTLTDGTGNPVAGKAVTLSAGSGSSTVSAASGPSDGTGVVTFTVKDATAESVAYSAQDATDSVALTHTASVTFTPISGGGGGGTNTLTQLVGGAGSVSSAPAGIACPSACAASFSTGASVTLTATPSAGNAFSGWAGDCSGTATTCTVTMSSDRTVGAFFGATGSGGSHTLAVAVAGSGTVTSAPAGISCRSVCSAQFAQGATVTLTASPAAGSAFVSWSGDCSGSSTCTVAMTDARAVAAEFAPSAGGGSTPAPPTASFTVSPAAPTPLSPVTFDASASTGASLTYSWTFGDSSATATGVTVQHTFTAAGTYTVKLTVVGAGGATASTAKSIQVGAAPASPPTSRWIEGTVVGALPFAPGGQAQDPPAANAKVVLESTSRNGAPARITTTDSSGHYEFKNVVAYPGELLLLAFAPPTTPGSGLGDWILGTNALSPQSLADVDGVIARGDHVLVEGSIARPPSAAAGVSPRYEVRATRGDGSALTLSDPGGVGTPGRYRLELPDRMTIEHPPGRSQLNSRIVLTLYENDLAIDSTYVSMPPAPSATDPPSAQTLPILQAPDLHAVLPPAAKPLQVEGTVTELKPFAPGATGGDKPFAHVSVTLAPLTGKALSTTTNANGHYAFTNLGAAFANSHARMTVDAGSGNKVTKTVAIGPAPSTTTVDVDLADQHGELLVSGQVLKPSGVVGGTIQLKAFTAPTIGGSAQPVSIPLQSPGGTGKYGSYRLGLLNPSGKIRIALYEGTTVVDSVYVQPGAFTGTVPDLHGHTLPFVASRALSGHLTRVRRLGLLQVQTENADQTHVKLSARLDPTTGAPANVLATTSTNQQGNYSFSSLVGPPQGCESCWVTFFSQSGVNLGSLPVKLGPDPSLTVFNARVGTARNQLFIEGTVHGVGSAVISIAAPSFQQGSQNAPSTVFIGPLNASVSAGAYAAYGGLFSAIAPSSTASIGSKDAVSNMRACSVSVDLGSVNSVSATIDATEVQPLVEIDVPDLQIP